MVLLLTVIFAAAILTGCGKGKDNGTNTGTGSGTITAGNLTKDIFKIIDNGEYHMKVKLVTSASDEDDGFGADLNFSIEYDCYVKDGMQAMVMEFIGTMRMIHRDGKTYDINDTFRMMSITEGIDDSEMEVTTRSEQLTYVGEKSGEFLGNTYKYDEFTGNDGMVYQYYVDGGKLKGIRLIASDGSITDMEILVFDKNVPDSVFDIPSDYEIE
jgi:hypothetical protein